MLLPNIRSVYERLGNFALNSDPALHQRLSKHIGKAVLIKTTEPYSVFYFIIRENDLHITSEHEGDEVVKVRLPLRTLVYIVFGIDKFSGYNRDIKIEGDKDLIFDLVKGLENNNIWSIIKNVLKTFIPEFETVEDFIKLLMGSEPSWVARFNCLPEMNRQILVAINDLQESNQKQLLVQKELLKEVVEVKKHNFCMLVLMIFMVLQYIIVSNEIDLTQIF